MNINYKAKTIQFLCQKIDSKNLYEYIITTKDFEGKQ